MGGMKPPPKFEEVDVDGSGGISLDEFKAAAPKDGPGGAGPGASEVESRFKAIDGDSDGSISQQEMTAFERQRRQEMEQAMLSLQREDGDALSGLLSLLGGDGEASAGSDASDATDGAGQASSRSLTAALDALMKRLSEAARSYGATARDGASTAVDTAA